MAETLLSPPGPLSPESCSSLDETCRAVRRWIVKMIATSGTGHVGGSMSCVEILVALYFHQARVDPARPDWPERDRILLSKGHAGPALYSTLAARGYFPLEELYTLDKPGTRLSKHVDRRKLPYVDMSAGMLGQGLSVGVGLALGARLTNNSSHVWAILGDGEQDCGQTWEAGMSAAKYRLCNLTGIIDRNRLQVDGTTEEVMPLEPLANKWRDFGWNVLETDGHSLQALVASYGRALEHRDGPTMIIARTKKGAGISFTENSLAWHNKSFTREQERQALEELGDKP